MNRTQETRLQKMELRSPERGNAVFVAWGRDREAAQRELASAYERGAVGKGDLAVAAVWPHGGDLPVSRFATFFDLEPGAETHAVLESIALEIGITDLNSFFSRDLKVCPRDKEIIAAMTGNEILAALVRKRMTKQPALST